jgi:hypothetical protein
MAGDRGPRHTGAEVSNRLVLRVEVRFKAEFPTDRYAARRDCAMRSPNAIDFWRGVALVMIFINHIPGMDYSHLTLRNYAISDAAELFVFLAGCSLALLAGNGRSGEKSLRYVETRLLIRTFDIWRAQVTIVAVALALLGAGALVFSDPLLLEWHNAGPAFYDTVRASIGLVLLTYQIGYFNILPLYVALLLIAAVLVAISRRSLALAMTASLALYVTTLAFELELPSWPAQGAWFFNPLSWQFIFMLGFATVAIKRILPAWDALMARLWPWAVALVMLGAVIVWIDYRPDPMLVPSPRFLFLFDKQFLSPARILSMIAIAIAFYPAFPVILRKLGPVARYCSSLGRNSLAVFCVGSLLALTGQIVRYMGEPTIVLDTAIVLLGLALLRGAAWISELQSAPP